MKPVLVLLRSLSASHGTFGVWDGVGDGGGGIGADSGADFGADFGADAVADAVVDKDRVRLLSDAFGPRPSSAASNQKQQSR